MFDPSRVPGGPRFRAVARPSVVRILILVVASALLAYEASFLVPTEYEGEARVLVGSLTETSTDQLDAYQQLAQTYSTIATSTSVLIRIIARLGLHDDPVRLGRRVDVRPMPGQAIIQIKARAPTPDDAAKLANEIAAEVVALGQQPTPGGPSLAAIFQPATPSGEPVAPRPLLNAAIASALALMLGVAVALVFPGRTAPAEKTGVVILPDRLRRQKQ